MSLQELQAEAERVGTATFTARDYGVGRVIHIVIFRYKAGVTEEQREEVARRFLALADSERDGLRYIRSIDAGPQISAEGTIVGDFDHAFVVTFDSLGDRNFYVGTPVLDDDGFIDQNHAAFKAFVGPFLDDGGVAVFDLAPDA